MFSPTFARSRAAALPGRSTRRLARLAMVAVVLIGIAAPAPASQVRSVSLEEMTARAAIIFSGRCVSRRVVRDVELERDVTVLTFHVDRTVKGQAGRTFTLRQIGGDDGTRGGLLPGLPRFAPGEEVVLFLYGESRRGLSSPVGLGQGKFSVVKDKAGRRVAVNAFGNARLLEGLSAGARRRLEAVDRHWRAAKITGPDRLLDMAEALLPARPARAP